MLIDYIRTGDQVEITYKPEGEHEVLLLSKVETVVDNKKILIHAPVYMDNVMKLPKNVVYSIMVLADKAMYRFDAEVIQYMKVDDYNIIALHLLSEGERVVKRAFFRFTCEIPMTFSIVKDKHGRVGSEIYEGVIKDISAGGMRFVSKQEIPEKTVIRATLNLGDSFVLVFGQVLHKYYVDTSYPHQYSVKFARMSDADQKAIIRYLHDDQRKSAQRIR